MKFLSPITDIERRFAVTLMLNAKINLPEKAEALRCYRDDLAKKQAAATKKKQVADKSREDAPAVPEHIYTSSLEHSPLKKRQRKDLTIDQGNNVESSSKSKSAAIALEPDSSMMLLSSGISSFRESTGFLERSNEFLLSADEEFLKGKKSEEVFNTGILSTFQALQAQLHLHDRYKIVSDKCAKFKMANETLKADKAKLDKAIKEQKQKNLALEEDLKGVKEEKNRHCDESTQANTVLVEQERLIKGLKEQLTSIAAKAMCKARAEIFKEYLSGEHVNWSRVEIQEVVDTYEEMLKLEGFREADEEVDAGGEVDKSLENLDNIESPSAAVVDPTREDA